MASPESSSLAGGPNNFRDRSPLRRRDSFDIPGGPMRMGGGGGGGGPMGRGEPDMGRPGDMMMGARGGSVRDYDGRPPEREWMGGNNRDFHMDPYPVDPYLERPRDPFAPPVADHHRGGFGAPPAPLASMKMANEVEIGN